MKTVVASDATASLRVYVSLRLKDDEYNVVAIGGRKNDNDFFAEHGMSYCPVNIKEESSLDVLKEIGDVHAVCHFAGNLPSRYEYDPRDLLDSITIGTLNVLTFIREHNYKKTMFPQAPYDLADHFDKMKSNGKLSTDLQRSFPKTEDCAVYVIAKNTAVDLIEYFHHTYNFSHFVLRFFTVYEYHPNAYRYANYKRRMMPHKMPTSRAVRSMPMEIWGDASKRREIVYIKDFIELVSNHVKSDIEGRIYNVSNGWQVSLEEQIRGIVEVFSPKDHPSKITYVPEKPDLLRNAFDTSKAFSESNWKPRYSYIDQFRDFKHETETEPFAKLWGTEGDYHE